MARLLPGLLLAALTLGVTLALHGPTLPLMRSHVPESAFHPGHAWIFDFIARSLGDGSLLGDGGLISEGLAFPAGAELRPIAWVPALLAAAFRPLLGPLGAYNLLVWLSPALSALAAAAALRRLAGAPPVVAAAAALPFALSPFSLGCLASGQVAKVQLWCLALPLLVAASAIQAPRRLGPWLALALSTLAASFTSPSLTLQLPFALGILALTRLERAPKSWGLAGAVLALAALSLLPAWAFYSPVTEGHALGGPVQALQPALAPTSHADIAQAVARLPTTLWPAPVLPAAATDTPHVTVLPWPLLLGALGLGAVAWRRGARRAALLGLGLALVGLTLASGEHLFWSEQPVRVGGRLLGLPALGLRALGYPLGDSGMYYRAIALAVLGLCTLVAAGAARLPHKWGAALSLLIGLSSMAEAVRVTAPLWPRAPVAGLSPALAAELAADPTPGAVLDLPLEHHGNQAEAYMLAAVSHGRATNGAPLLLRSEDLPHLGRLKQDVWDALRTDNPHSALSELGFRYVIWHQIGWDGGPGQADIEAALGPGERRDGVVVWRVGAGLTPPRTPR